MYTNNKCESTNQLDWFARTNHWFVDWFVRTNPIDSGRAIFRRPERGRGKQPAVSSAKTRRKGLGISANHCLVSPLFGAPLERRFTLSTSSSSSTLVAGPNSRDDEQAFVQHARGPAGASPPGFTLSSKASVLILVPFILIKPLGFHETTCGPQQVGRLAASFGGPNLVAGYSQVAAGYR